MKKALTALLAFAAPTAFAGAAHAEDPFSYDPPGQLVPAKSGEGRVDDKVYLPGMRFPMEEGPAFANSQVWGHGGGSGPTGTDQCDDENFSYPWHDTYCEDRSWDMPLCPSGTGHQGDDVRASTCEKNKHWVVAVADGKITNVGSYSVYLTLPDGTRLDYLHMGNVQVKTGDEVKQGQRMGQVSNVFGGSATTVHLHFNMRQNVDGVGVVFVPPYMSLIKSYEVLMGIDQDAGSDAAPPAPDAAPPVQTPTEVEVPAPPPPEESCLCRGAPGKEVGSAGMAASALIVAGFVARRRQRRR